MHLPTPVALALSGLLSFSLMGCGTTQLQPAAPAQTLTLSSANMLQHLHALQKIAQTHAHNRAIGTEGGRQTVQYIRQTIKNMGLEPAGMVFKNRHQLVGENVIVEIQGQSKDTAIIIGAHHDSVPMGPGINDNGSGVAVLLELIRQLKQQPQPPKHTLYFAFWDSEEDGIGGAQHFVNAMTSKQLEGIQAYINLDMVGTKDSTIQIADGDRSSIAEMENMLKARGMAENDYKPITDSLAKIPHHPQDVVLEQHLRHFFTARNIKVKDDVSTLTASDSAPFLGKVPVTSVIFFNQQMKGDELEFAPCYHKACDTLDLIDPKSMQIAGEAALSLVTMLNATSK
ncbi:M20/M25/M40 family metallo-hydrolase [Acinetobacter sp. B51(2017)]|uniref:M28 family metallopeptidase n=1 Tax=Acinetobacter sp. B51(2017) TaxID=2060938 RepID=UPI000F08DF4E|nr:M20/M25/M40 family metallo-hydrolase [Acinetobacter sp. B51(2017)]